MGLFPQPRAHPPSHRSLQRSPGQRREAQEEQWQRQEKPSCRKAPKAVDVTIQDSIFLEENVQASLELVVEGSPSALFPENDVVSVGSKEKADEVEENDGKMQDLGTEVNLEPPEMADDDECRKRERGRQRDLKGEKYT